MLLIRCPYCGEARAEIEFAYAGEAHIARPEIPGDLSDRAWGEYMFYRANPRGPHAERWRHVHGCGRFFNLLRNTATDEILATYQTGAARPKGAA